MKGKTIISILVLVAVVALIVLLGRDSMQNNIQEVSLEATQDDAFDLSQVDQLLMVQLKEGEGEGIVEGQTAVVHYTGFLVDGVIFDSSRTRGVPFEFVLGSQSVIEGWEIGIKGMKIGEERRLIIPATMAYGDQQVGPIAPNSTLVFNVELLEIK